jgi:hypothetical protein
VIEKTDSQASNSNELIIVDEVVDHKAITDKQRELLADSHAVQNLQRGMRELVSPIGLTINDFFYNPFGHGSLLEQAIWFLRDKAFHGQPNTLVNMSLSSRMLNEIIDREMRLMGIIIEERFVFESVNAFNAGGEMSVKAYAKDGSYVGTYHTWTI